MTPEVDELRHAAPALASLLADNHPARDRPRNSFRLGRLAAQPGDRCPANRSGYGGAMVANGDGAIDQGQRDRARPLRALAELALSGTATIRATDHPAPAVGCSHPERVAPVICMYRLSFRDTSRGEWAVCGLLSSEPESIERLPLANPAPATLARGVELTAVRALERNAERGAWQVLLDRLSLEGVHGGGVRVLLALVRSEASTALLTRAAVALTADDARLLRELIRTVRAVAGLRRSCRSSSAPIADRAAESELTERTLVGPFDSLAAWPRRCCADACHPGCGRPGL